jgi:hypothetical protein
MYTPSFLSISKRSPFTKYGLNTEIKFSYGKPDRTPKWEYSWFATHKLPKKFEGEQSPYIATDIDLSKPEREMIDNYLTTGKINTI